MKPAVAVRWRDPAGKTEGRDGRMAMSGDGVDGDP